MFAVYKKYLFCQHSFSTENKIEMTADNCKTLLRVDNSIPSYLLGIVLLDFR